MKRKPYPHEEIVQKIRLAIQDMDLRQFTDDSDMYYERVAGYSPMLRQGEHNTKKRKHAKALGEQLVEIGEPAAEAMALGFRLMGGWRENLLPFAEKFRKVPIIREALRLVAKRMNDPLAGRARELIQ
jgi:hypothetical protein